jgi:hypothetical protein
LGSGLLDFNLEEPHPSDLGAFGEDVRGADAIWHKADLETRRCTVRFWTSEMSAFAAGMGAKRIFDSFVRDFRLGVMSGLDAAHKRLL